MEFNFVGDGIDAVVIDNFYTEDQLKEIMLELQWLTKPSVMLSQGESLGSSVNVETGEVFTSKRGVFLEEVFKNWKHSALIKYAMDNFLKEEVRNKLYEFSTFYKILYHCDSRTHLVSYYENSDYYKPHTDQTTFTVLNWFSKEPKQFTGGNLKVYSCNSDKIAEIEFKHNRVVIVTGSTYHEVTKIESQLTNTLSTNGRYCNSIFLNMAEHPVPKEMKVKQ